MSIRILFAASLVLPLWLHAAPEPAIKDDLKGKVVWPEEYFLDIHKPDSQIAEGKNYLANVVQNLISDELSLQRSAITRSRVRPSVIEYPVHQDHENLPTDERKALLTKQPKPPVLPLKIIRRTEATGTTFSCTGLQEERYSLLTRISGRLNQLKLEALLCQGNESLMTQTTTVDEQELVNGVNRLISSVRAKLTGDQYASLQIETTPPRASVYLDNQFLGKSPLKYSYLIPGKYTLVVKQDGFETVSAAVDALTGETFAGKYALPRAKTVGIIDIISEPAGAKIYLDADYKGLTPKKIENVPAGTYRVHVLHPEKGEIYKSVTISENNSQVQISETLSEFAFQKTPGLLGMSYKTWYWVTLASSAVCFGSAIGFYIWRDQAQEDIFSRLSGTPVSLYTQADHDFTADRNSAYKTRESFATGFMVSAGVLFAFSIYFYVKHLLSADEGIVMKEKPKKEGDVDVQIGGIPGQTAVSASFRF